MLDCPPDAADGVAGVAGVTSDPGQTGDMGHVGHGGHAGMGGASHFVLMPVIMNRVRCEEINALSDGEGMEMWNLLEPEGVDNLAQVEATNKKFSLLDPVPTADS